MRKPVESGRAVYAHATSSRIAEILGYPARMLSHACARCGKPLDATTRSFAPSVAMWVARCPRCGTTVRWSPRRGREAFRLWARTRALNLRLGVALACGQLAGLLASIYAAILGNEASFFATPITKGNGPEVIALVFLLGGFMALSAAVSAVLFAPHRDLSTRLACAWLLGALPVPMALIVLGTTPQYREISYFLREVHTKMGFATYFAYLAIPVLMSACLALLLKPLADRISRTILRRHFRANADRLRGLAPARQPHHSISHTP